MTFIYEDDDQSIIQKIEGSTNSITIPSKVIKIRSNSTTNCEVQSITFDSGSQLSELEQEAFYSTNTLTKIDMKECLLLSYLPIWCFRRCGKLTSIILPENGALSLIKSGAFIECLEITQITIPSSVISFEDCTFPGGAVFHSCKSLKFIYFPVNSKCNHLGELMFWGCSSLVSFIAPPLVNELPRQLFQYCNSLKNIVIFSLNPIIQSTIFQDITDPSVIFIYVTSKMAFSSFVNIGVNENKIIIIPFPTFQHKSIILSKSFLLTTISFLF